MQDEKIKNEKKVGNQIYVFEYCLRNYNYHNEKMVTWFRYYCTLAVPGKIDLDYGIALIFYYFKLQVKPTQTYLT